jgi:ubiquinone/menaquinone biosynthesis C-methylase UbiE
MKEKTMNEGLKEQQYSNADKFNARIYLHAKFSSNTYLWPLWVFDQIDKIKHAKVLELGSGNGLLWMANANRIPLDWDITVSDFSEGMLNAARKNLSSIDNHIQFETVDAEKIDYPDDTFDIVIANHMLYHLSNRREALSQIKRVMKQNGTFYATTIGMNNMLEMKQLVKEFDAHSNYDQMLGTLESKFSMDNGQEQLNGVFEDVKLIRYENSLHVNEPEALVNYVLSLKGLEADMTAIDPNKTEAFKEFINRKMIKNGGEIVISTESGIFIAK